MPDPTAAVLPADGSGPAGGTRVAVLGAGLMGSGIAACTAAAGHEVVVFDPAPAALERSHERFEDALRRRAADADPAAGGEHRAAWTDDLAAAVSGATVVIEAAPEDEQIKLELFGKLDRLAEPDAILATNTSAIPVGRLARAIELRGRMLGLHFFSPADVMPLVEVVVALETEPAAVERARAFCVGIGKHPIEVGDRAGFVVNRLLVPFLLTAARMAQDGEATPEAIDAGMKLGAGHPVGPLRLIDAIGVDVVVAAAAGMHAEYKSAEYLCPPLLARMADAGHLGRKSGRGFFEYDLD